MPRARRAKGQGKNSEFKNRRVTKTVLGMSGTTYSVVASAQTFLYDGNRMIAELGLSGTTPVVAKSYYWGLEVAGWRDGQSLDGAGGIGGLWMVQSGTNAYFPMYDPMGNVLSLAKAGTNEKSATYRYDPYGNLLSVSGSAASVNPFRFSTQYYDEELGSHHFLHRELKDGRWLNRDAIGENGGPNLYACCRNDPVNNLDAYGFETIGDKITRMAISRFSFGIITPIPNMIFRDFTFSDSENEMLPLTVKYLDSRFYPIWLKGKSKEGKVSTEWKKFDIPRLNIAIAPYSNRRSGGKIGGISIYNDTKFTTGWWMAESWQVAASGQIEAKCDLKGFKMRNRNVDITWHDLLDGNYRGFGNPDWTAEAETWAHIADYRVWWSWRIHIPYKDRRNEEKLVVIPNN